MGMEKVSGERKKRRMRQKKVTAVQKLYDTCTEVFADCGPGVIPNAEGIERLKDILSKILITMVMILDFYIDIHTRLCSLSIWICLCVFLKVPFLIFYLSVQWMIFIANLNDQKRIVICRVGVVWILISPFQGRFNWLHLSDAFIQFDVL